VKGVQLDCKSKREGINGCLFDLENDPSEEHDLALEQPELLQELIVQFNTLLRRKPGFELMDEMIGEDACPDGASLKKKVGYGATELACGCWVAMHVYNLFDGPYQDLPAELIDFGFDSEATHEHPKGGVDSSGMNSMTAMSNGDRNSVRELAVEHSNHVSRNITRQGKEIRYGNLYLVLSAMCMMVLIFYARRRENDKVLETEVREKRASYGAVDTA